MSVQDVRDVSSIIKSHNIFFSGLFQKMFSIYALACISILPTLTGANGRLVTMESCAMPPDAGTSGQLWVINNNTIRLALQQKSECLTILMVLLAFKGRARERGQTLSQQSLRRIQQVLCSCSGI